MTVERIDPKLILVHQELEHENYSRTDAELEVLDNQIVSDEGIRDPFTLWPAEINGKRGLWCVDGFSRLRISLKRSFMTVPYVIREFESLEHAKIWIRLNQDSRRNLTDFQRSYYMGRLYNDMVSKPSVLRAYCVQRGIELVEKERASEILGSVYGVSEKTIRRASKMAKGLDKVNVIDQALGRGLLSAEAGIVASAVLELAADMNLDDLEGIASVEDLKRKVKPVQVKNSGANIEKANDDQVKSRFKPEVEKKLRKAFEAFMMNPDAPALSKVWKLMEDARKGIAAESVDSAYMEVSQNSKAS